MPPASPNRRRTPGSAARIAIAFGGPVAFAIVIMAPSAALLERREGDPAPPAGAGQRSRWQAGGRTPEAPRRDHPPDDLPPPGRRRRLARLTTKTEFKSAQWSR